MPQLQNNNKGQPGGVATGTNYVPLVKAQYLCNEALNSTGLTDETGSLNLAVQGGTVPVIAGGADGGARGPCQGTFGAGGDGFASTPAGGGVWDTRQVAGSFTKGTFLGWARLQAGHGATQEFASQCRLAAASNTRAWILRGVQDFGGTEGPVFLGWDGSAFTLSTGFNFSGTIPHNTWYMLGWSIDITAGIFVGYVGIPGVGEFSVINSSIPANMFSHTVLDQNTMIGIDSGHSTGGQGFEVDHISWMKDYAFADEAEFSQFYNSGTPLAYPGGFDLSVPGGGTVVHNDHGAGNGHGSNGNR